MSGSSVLSDEVRVAFAPAATYEELMMQRPPAWWRMLARPGLVLLLIGTIVPIMAVHRVSLGLVAASMLSWSFVLAIQILAAVAVIASALTRRFSLLRSLDLWFAAHLPYSLWMLIVAGSVWATETARHDLLILTAAAPAVWTIAILVGYCRTVLGTTITGALWRIAAHQCFVWALAFGYVLWSAGGWSAVASAAGRRLSAQ